MPIREPLFPSRVTRSCYKRYQERKKRKVMSYKEKKRGEKEKEKMSFFSGVFSFYLQAWFSHINKLGCL